MGKSPCRRSLLPPPQVTFPCLPDIPTCLDICADEEEYERKVSQAIPRSYNACPVGKLMCKFTSCRRCISWEQCHLGVQGKDVLILPTSWGVRQPAHAASLLPNKAPVHH